MYIISEAFTCLKVPVEPQENREFYISSLEPSELTGMATWI